MRTALASNSAITTRELTACNALQFGKLGIQSLSHKSNIKNNQAVAPPIPRTTQSVTLNGPTRIRIDPCRRCDNRADPFLESEISGDFYQGAKIRVGGYYSNMSR